MRTMPRRDQAGFTLVEMLMSLVLLLLALAIAAELLGESQQMLVDAARESRDPSAPLVATQLRADILGASNAAALQNPDTSCALLQLVGHDEGTIVYQLVKGQLVRTVVAADGTVVGSSALLRGASDFECAATGTASAETVMLTYGYLRAGTRRSPLALVRAPPAPQDMRESLVLVPRAAGLGGAW